ncbi:MAG: ThiF family adenylyltransferase, partial [Ginsengibacter sp.]
IKCTSIMQADFTRYSCQLALPGFDEATQERLQHAKVLIAGAGGLGCPAALYLAASGVGIIGIADYDTVSMSNLHRQVLYSPAEIGLKKAYVSYDKLRQQNPSISVIPHDIRITAENVMDLIMSYDMVLDCTDNFETKFLLNDACVLAKKPLVYGAIYQYEGQAAMWNVLNADGTYSPNYRDVFPEVNSLVIPNCTDGGVMPTLAGIIGCIQANEVIKYFTNSGEILAGKLLMLDAASMLSRIIKTGTTTKTHITALPKIEAVPVITTDELKKEIDNNIYELIDVRTSLEHSLYNIGGKNFPLDEIEKNTHELDPGKPIVLYCSTGKRSGEAVKFISNKFPALNIFSLEGGLLEWDKTETPITSL